MSPFLSFVAPPFAGHLYPLLELASAAQAAGHRVEVLTGGAKVAAVRAAGLPAAALASLEGAAAERIADTGGPVGSGLFGMARQMRQALGLVAPVRDELAARWRADPPALVVADFAAVPAGLAATALGLPWITTLLPPFVLEVRDGPPSYLGGWRPMEGPMGRLRDAAGWAAVGGAKASLALAFRRDLAAAGVTRLRPDGSEAIYSPLAIVAPWMRELEFGQRFPPHLHFIGPLFGNPERLPPLDLPARPRVLVSYGTHLPWAKAGLVTGARALARRLDGVSFVVSLGDLGRPSWIEADGRVRVHGFVPYAAEVSRFDAVVHHGGAGILGATVAAGRPALVCPQDFDQFDGAARVVHHGLGLRVRRLTDAAAARALRDLLDRPRPALPRFQEAAAAYRPRERFVALAERLLAAQDGAGVS